MHYDIPCTCDSVCADILCACAQKRDSCGRNKMAIETKIDISTISWNIDGKAVRIEYSLEIKVLLSVWIVIINFRKEMAVRILPYRINFQLAIC